MGERMTNEPNVEFYMNKIKSQPNGDYIENILTTWKGDYPKLRTMHCSYMQWLFPNRQAGRNETAYPLTEMEAEIIRECPDAQDRVKRAFEMMLDYFGMELVGARQFKLTPNGDEQLKNHNVWGSNTFMHITRILLALKELGHKDLMFPWMNFLAQLIYKEKKLDQAEQSFEDFWIPTLDEIHADEIMILVDDLKK